MHRTGEQVSDQRGSVENEVELIWEAKTINTTDHAPRLQSLSDEKPMTRTVALMDIVRNTLRPVRPKKRKKYGCKFCTKVFVNTNNCNKHTAIYHIPGAKFKIPRESSLICISCGKPYKNQRSLIKHSKRCAGTIMIDTLQDISENEIKVRV